MTELEERLKNLPVNRCRACEHFVRVNFDGYENVMNRQGFCLLGQLDGEYSLYVSTSRSGDCMGFILSEKNLTITEAEHQLNRDVNDYISRLGDKRTADYKEIEPLLKAHQKFIESTENKYKGLAWMHAEMAIREVGCKHFRELNTERYKDIYHMVSLRKADYSKFLAKLSIEIHDQFCKCQKIEFKEEKRSELPDIQEQKIKLN